MFAEKSAFERSVDWAKRNAVSGTIAMFCSEKDRSRIQQELSALNADSCVRVCASDKWNSALFAKECAAVCKETASDYALFSFTEYPFIDQGVTDEVCRAHTEYRAEYTFADGWPEGFAPAALDAGAAAVIAELAAQPDKPEYAVSERCIFDTIRQDINSFEVETVISPVDYRQYRLHFGTDSKAAFTASCALLEAARASGVEQSAASLSALAVTLPQVLCTVPCFYNVQIASGCGAGFEHSPYPAAAKERWPGRDERMDFTAFCGMVKKIAAFSEQAVVSLSAWGEPLLHPQFCDFAREVIVHDGLSLLVETDGAHFDEALFSALEELAAVMSGHSPCAPYPKIMWILTADYSAAAKLVEIFGDVVYPQFLRTTQSEPQLEQFYRFWSDRQSPSHGKLIVKKYDHFCRTLPDLRPADLAPLVRYPCWHLLRDMDILLDGGVTHCHERVLRADGGNVFAEELGVVWGRRAALVEKHIEKAYGQAMPECTACDEYYTFNF